MQLYISQLIKLLLLFFKICPAVCVHVRVLQTPRIVRRC